MYEMKPEYYIGIDMIDEEHKQLFKYADEAYELLRDEFTPDKYDRIDIILENLRNYTVKHFCDEEQYMESINYKKIFTQKVQHQEFIHKLDEFMEHHNDEVEDQDEQIMDILKYLIKPTGAFFPGFTLIAMLAGLIYGSFYYKKELSFWRVLAAHVVVAIICNVILNTWCLSILYGKAFSVLLPARLVKNAIMCPIDAFIFYNIAKVLDVTGIFKLVKEEKK